MSGSKEEARRRKEEEQISIYDAIQCLIEHGHDKDKILREYSREEIMMYYEKCVKQDMRKNAYDCEMTAMAIGLAFSGNGNSGKRITKLLDKMKE